MIRTGHKPEDWRDEGPSYARIPSHHGELVRGEPGNVAKNRRDQEKHKATEDARQRALAYERTKRWRQRQKDAA